MDKSKLPKPSGLKPPQIRSKVPENTNSRFGNSENIELRRIVRRSKSVTDLRSLKASAPLKQIKPLASLNENNAKIMRRRSKSITDITQNKKTAGVAPRTAVKRVATAKPADVTKPKVAKQSKLPDWDYKGRFNQLTDKYKILQENYKTMKEKAEAFGDIEENYEQVQEQLKIYHKEQLKLKDKTKCLSEENKTINETNKKIDSELKTLRESYDILSGKYAVIKEQERTNTNTIAQLDSENQELSKKLSQLKKDHEELTTSYEQLTNKHGRLQLEYDTINVDNKDLSNRLAQKTEECRVLIQEKNELKLELQNSEVLRRQLHNTIQDLKGNIRVFCRVRPPINTEEEDRLQCLFNFVDEHCLEIRKTRESVSISGKPQDVKAEFTFDKVFNQGCTQSEVFEELAQLVQSALDGYNVCVFAYGQTGSGKTHTMQGDLETPSKHGMIPRTINLIYESIKKLNTSGWSYQVSASFLEIYNENINDLLQPKSDKSFEIRYNEGKGTTVTNLTIQKMKSATELLKWMTIAHRNRAVAATDFNEHSSRSHAVTKIYLEGVNTESNTSYCGSLNLVDLAGSESAKTSANERMVETKNINKSLSTLGSVMLALYNKDNHIPYRNSKLTYLLQSCLGGNSKTLMFVNISPFEECYIESINSLRFAAKVKEVKLGSKRNKTYNAITAK